MAMGLCSSARFVCGDIFVVITTGEEQRPAPRVCRVPSEEPAARGMRANC